MDAVVCAGRSALDSVIVDGTGVNVRVLGVEEEGRDLYASICAGKIVITRLVIYVGGICVLIRVS